MSVIMSVMNTAKKSVKKTKPAKAEVLPSVFTVRDMNRNTAKVLAACRLHGRVLVRSRGGEEFEVAPMKVPKPPETPEDREERVKNALERMRLHREKIRAMGMRGPQTPEEIERVNQIIAGEI